MRIAVVGGTGKEGRGLAIRWSKAGHDVVIGSRSAERGAERAAELNEEYGCNLTGAGNEACCEGAEVVVLSVPYGGHADTCRALREHLQGKIVVDITVPLKPPKVRSVHLPDGQAAALEAKEILGDDVRVVATMHHVSSMHLADLSHDIACDVLVAGDTRAARDTVIGLIGDLGMKGVDCGVLRNAIALESLTPVLLYINKRYDAPGAGVRITNLPEEA